MRPTRSNGCLPHAVRGLPPPAPKPRLARPPRASARAWTALALVCAPLLGACQGPVAGAGQPARVELVELVESFPIETTLDQPDLREAQDVWLEAIQGAERSIDLCQFYLSDAPGSRLRPVIDALLEAAARGIQVRVLADAGFSKTYPETLAEFERTPGCLVRLYDMQARTGGVLHAKAILVDGERAYLGSQNFDYRSLEHINELGVWIEGRDLAQGYQAVFDFDWAAAGDPEFPNSQFPGNELHGLAYTPPATVPVIVHGATAEFGSATATWTVSPENWVPTVAHGHWDYPELVRAVEGAQHEIALTTLSYQPFDSVDGDSPSLHQALLDAAARGVRVRMMVADWSKRGSRVEALKALAREPNLELRFTSIPDWSGGFVPFARVCHAKYLVIDGDWSWISTGNFGRDYFFESRNLGLILEGQGPAHRLQALYDSLWNSPYAEPLDPAANYTPRRVSE